MFLPDVLLEGCNYAAYQEHSSGGLEGQTQVGHEGEQDLQEQVYSVTALLVTLHQPCYLLRLEGLSIYILVLKTHESLEFLQTRP